MPEDLIEACGRPSPVSYDGLRGLTPIDAEAYWAGRDTAWEGAMNVCDARANSLLGIIGDANRIMGEIVAPEPRERPWWRPW